MAQLLPDWADLKLILAMARAGTMAKAAETLNINGTTVFRRLRALDRASMC